MIHKGNWRIQDSRRQPGFTLVEAIVVLAILGILIALTLPAVQLVRSAAVRTQCAANLRQLALGVHHYAAAHGPLPQGCAYLDHTDPRYYQGQPGLSWLTSTLPYVEQDALWQRTWEANVQDPSGQSPLHLVVGATPVPSFLCPAEVRQLGGGPDIGHWGLTSYQGVAGTSIWRQDGMFHKDFTVRFTDVTDGTSSTLMIGERPSGPDGSYGSWYSEWGHTLCPLAATLSAGTYNSWQPDGCGIVAGPLRPGRLDDTCAVTHFWSLHRNGANFAFADGSVRFLPNSASGILPALATRAGGEVVDANDY
jgi:prepilin-type N-terminal cleavage/methylation domain-containing protein/prepilin-type processing-associated H-X9-DG protein